MNIPELNERHLQMFDLLAFATNGLFILIKPLATDGLESYSKYMLTNNDADYLTEIGLWDNVTDSNVDYLGSLNARTQREFRAFRFTELGEQMFMGTSPTLTPEGTLKPPTVN
jgi:hypothetical protein